MSDEETISISDAESEGEGPNIRPPQAAGGSGFQSKKSHKQKHRDDEQREMRQLLHARYIPLAVADPSVVSAHDHERRKRADAAGAQLTLQMEMEEEALETGVSEALLVQTPRHVGEEHPMDARRRGRMALGADRRHLSSLQ